MKERPKKTLWQEFKKNPPLYIGLFPAMSKTPKE